MRRPRLPALTTALVTVLALAACSDPSSSSAGPSPSSPTTSANPTMTPTKTPTMTLTPTIPAGPTYVALGDSYTAAPYVPVTDPANHCLRSSGNYPAIVAKALPQYGLVDVSCSGASSTSMVAAQINHDQANGAQFDALTDRTALVTLGLGANDHMLFSTLMGTCTSMSTDAGPDPCTQHFTAGGKDQLRAKLKDTLDLLTAVIKEIRDRAPKAEIVVVDYPQVVPEKVACPLLPIKPGDLPYVHGILQLLAATVHLATTRAKVGATSIDLWRASAGHDICSKDPWINGKDSDPQRAAAYHPLAVEQQAAARLVMAAIRAAPAAK